MTLEEKVVRVSEITSEVRRLSSERFKLQKEIANEMIDKDLSTIEVDDNLLVEFVWKSSPMLDLKALKDKYPTIYQLGSYDCFSKDIAMANSTRDDLSIITTAIKECTKKNKEGEVVVSWRKKKGTFKKG